MALLIHVVAAVIHRNGKYFIAQRPAHKQHGGSWEFPGGKISSGESLETAIIRELEEELNLAVEQPICELTTITDGLAIHFLQVSVSGRLVLNEHQESRWCTPTELLELPLCPIDERFVRENA